MIKKIKLKIKIKKKMKKKLTKQTKSVREKDIKRNWYLIDLENKVLGRVVSKIALILQGKNKVDYVPYLDSGDYVVAINASKVNFTGRKIEQKTYTRYSGYPGGLKFERLKELMNKSPEKVVSQAVSGMLPKNKFRKQRLKRLFIFRDDNYLVKDLVKEKLIKIS